MRPQPTGTFAWVQQAVGAGNDRGTAVALDTAGNPYLTGYLTADTLFGSQLLKADSFGNSFIALFRPRR